MGDHKKHEQHLTITHFCDKIDLTRKVVRTLTDKERKDTKMATLYELRLILKKNDKKEYTLEELFELLDNIADAKDQEM